MTQQNLILINGVLCEHTSSHHFIMYGRLKRITKQGHKIIERHLLSGRFISMPLKTRRIA